MAKLEVKLISKPSKLKILKHYDITVDGEFWGKTVDFQTSIDCCWRIYQQRSMGLSYIRNQTSRHNSGSGKFKDKQEVIAYVESSPTCYKENPNIFIDNNSQPKSIRNDPKNIQPQNARPRNNHHKKKNSRK